MTIALGRTAVVKDEASLSLRVGNTRNFAVAEVIIWVDKKLLLVFSIVIPRSVRTPGRHYDTSCSCSAMEHETTFFLTYALILFYFTGVSISASR